VSWIERDPIWMFLRRERMALLETERRGGSAYAPA
jgi:hypothetical protein